MKRYSLVQRLLHWIIALIVIGTLAGGLTLSIYDGFEGTKEAFGLAVTNMIYKYHKTFGVIILAAMTVRLIARLIYGKPDYAEPLTRFEHVASTAVHHLLYVLLLVQPTLGWLATGAAGFPVEFFNSKLPPILGKDKALGEMLYEWHGVIGWLIFVLLILHVCGALKHWLINRDSVMQRMSLFG